MKYLLGLCIGTSSTKAIITDTDGKIINSSIKDYKFDIPFPGWTEQDPEIWFTSTVLVIKDIIEKSHINPKDILILGISGQMHSTVFLDKHNKVIRPAPLWNDQRTVKECEFLIDNIGFERVLELTSNRPLSSFSLPKIMWLKNIELNNFNRLRKICLSKDYIKLRLSGKLSTDPSDASGTLCYDVKNHKWSNDLFKELGLDTNILPEVQPSDDFSSRINKDGSLLTGLPEGLPILTGTGDTAGEMLGNGIFKDGDCLIILGTGGVVLIYHSRYYKNDGNLDMFCFLDGRFYSLGVTLSSSASLTWGLNNIGLNLNIVTKKMDKNIGYSDFVKYIGENKYNILEEEVKEIGPGSDGLIFLPYLAGERAPYSDPGAKGVLFGLNLNHDRRHIHRAIMEGVAFSHRDCFEIIKKKEFDIKKIVISGGGSKNKTWCQIYSDILNYPVIKLSIEEGPSLGMCLLGTVALKIYDSIDEASNRFLKINKTFYPDIKNVPSYENLYKIYNGLYPKLKDSFIKIDMFQRNIE